MKRFLKLALCFFTMCAFAQQTQYVDFKKADVNVSVNIEKKSVSGLVTYYFDVLQMVDSVFVDAKNMGFSDVSLDGNEVEYRYDSEKLWIKRKFKPSKNKELSISFESSPTKALYFVEKGEESQVWTQGQGKYTSNWLPSFDDVNEKIEFDISVIADSSFSVISNGNLLEKTDKKGYNLWRFNMDNPMPSYLVALVVGKFNKQTLYSESGIPIELYYYPEDSLKVEPTYRYTKQMFDFLEKEIGYKYPWQVYKQVPVHDFLYAGMENTSCTIFSDAFVVDEAGFNDRNYVNVNAHELAHQWFGDLVTAKSGEHHWLQEGFATYYALLAEQDVFGENYYFWRLYEYAQELQMQDKMGQGTSLLNPQSSSLTFYKRGCWVLHALREKVGATIFKQAVEIYLEKHAFGNVETTDFISEVEVLYGKSLSEFANLWIKNKDFPFEEAQRLLLKSPFIQEYEMVDCEAANSKCNYYLDSYVSDEAKIKIIQQKPELINSKTFNNSVKVRKAIAQVLSTIPKQLKTDYESLLRDASYITVETALYNLWSNFPEERQVYLNQVEATSLKNQATRILWLVLALSTPDFNQGKKPEYYEELVSFTSKDYNYEVRMSAFEYLLMLNACNETCEINLEEAKNHHNWRMSKFAKEQMELLKTNKN